MAATINWRLIDAATGQTYTGGAVRTFGVKSGGTSSGTSWSSYGSSGSFTFDRYQTGGSGWYFAGSGSVIVDLGSSGYDRNLTRIIVEADSLGKGTSWQYTEDSSATSTELERYILFTTTQQGNSASSASGSATVTVYLKKAATVSFNANGGSGAPSAVTGVAGSAVVLPVGIPTLSGQVFKGWSTVQGGSAAYQPGETVSFASSCTLYAVWAPTTVTVSYDLDGAPGSAPESGSCVVGEVPCQITSSVPTFQGYLFGGWCARYSPGESRYFGEPTTLVAEWR